MCAAIDSSPFPFSSPNRRRCALSVNCQKSTCRRSTSGLSPDPDSHLESELDAECYVDHRQVKGLLKDKKLERLVDGNLEGNYTEEEVEQVIQVALLCTHNSPMQRPTTREAVRMLQGHGLAKRRWEQLLKQEVFY